MRDVSYMRRTSHKLALVPFDVASDCVLHLRHTHIRDKAVEQWLMRHPRLTLLCVPTYCPRANPIERLFGDVHDQCTRHHKRKRLCDLRKDVERYMREHGP